MITDEDLQENEPAPAAGALTRRDFGGVSVQRESVATAALVAQARASVEARYTMAMHRPRSIENARIMLLKECRRPGFAETARYAKPVGGGAPVEGPSIRFAEAAARCMGNIYTEEFVVYEDDERIVMRVVATDLESNVTYPRDVRIRKAVEVKKVPKGTRVLGQRTNSYGDPVFLIPADEDRLANKIGAQVSKALRVCLLRLIPGDLIDDGQELCIKVANDRAAKDPDGERKRLLDAFALVGIMPTELERWLGHALSSVAPGELVDLRKAYSTLRDGESTWAEILDNRLEALSDRKSSKSTPAAAPEKPSDSVSAAKEAPVVAAEAPRARESEEAAAPQPRKSEEARVESAAVEQKAQGTFDAAATAARARDAAREAEEVARKQAAARAVAPAPAASKGTAAAKAAITQQRGARAPAPAKTTRPDGQMEEPDWMRDAPPPVDEDPV